MVAGMHRLGGNLDQSKMSSHPISVLESWSFSLGAAHISTTCCPKATRDVPSWTQLFESWSYLKPFRGALLAFSVFVACLFTELITLHWEGSECLPSRSLGSTYKHAQMNALQNSSTKFFAERLGVPPWRIRTSRIWEPGSNTLLSFIFDKFVMSSLFLF